MLKQDHQAVEDLFKQFERAGANAHVTRRNLVDRMIQELSVHAAIEEQIFYPVTRETVPAVEDQALEGLEEHHLFKLLLDELDGMDPTEERFAAKVTVLMENVRHHQDEEEADYFPKVREELGRNALNEIGDAMDEVKASVPTHPHPYAPDTPPANVVVGAAAGVVDRVGDTVSGLAQGSVSAALDLVARVRGTKKSQPAPTGSPTAKKVAADVRAKTAEAVDKVAGAKDEAERTGRATTKAATSGAKATVTSARKAATGTARSAATGAQRTRKTAATGAKQTRSTAKRAATSTKRAADAKR